MIGGGTLTLMRWKARAALHAVRRAGWAQKTVAFLFLTVGAAVFGGVYVFFDRGFGFMLAEPTVGPVITRYALELCFATVFFFGVTSFVISAVPLLFRIDDPAFIAGLPVPPSTLFVQRFISASVIAAWPVVLIAVPALWALGNALGAGVYYGVMAAMIVLLSVLGMALFSAVLSFVYAASVRRLSAWIRHFLELAAFMAIAVAGARRFVSREMFAMLQADTPEQAAAATAHIRDLFAFLPSHHAAEAVAAVLPFSSGGSEGVTWLAVGCMLLVLLLGAVVRASYLPLLQGFREGTFIAGPSDVCDGGFLRTPFPRLFRWRHGFLFEKDLLTFVRDPDEVSRAGFLLTLLVLYVLALGGLSGLQAFAATDLFAAAVTFSFAATGYFALTFGLRFAFPSLSLEGKSAWVLWASPVHAHEFFSWKFFFWAALITAVMEAVSWVGAALFGLPLALAGFLAFATLCSSVSVIAVTLGQGSLFPRFAARTADELATTPAGLAATGIALGYLWVVARYVYRFAGGFLSGGGADLIEAFGILIVSLAVVVVYWTLARRRMDTLEIA